MAFPYGPQGRAGAPRTPPSHPKSAPKSPLRGILAGLIVIVAASVAIYFALGGKGKISSISTPSPSTIISSVSNPVSVVVEAKSPVPISNNTKNISSNAQSLATNDLPEKAQVKLNPRRFPPTNQVFKTGLDQRLAGIFTRKVGAHPPIPLPPLSKKEREQMWNLLKSENKIFDGDNEQVAEAKQTVSFAKKEMLKYIKEGGDPDDFISYYNGQLRKAYEYRKMIMKEAMKVKRESPEIFDEFVRKGNERLRDEGILELPENFGQDDDE